MEHPHDGPGQLPFGPIHDQWNIISPTARSSPGHRRILRLIWASASDEFFASSEPWPRLGPPVPRLPAHDTHTTDGTQGMPSPILQQGMTPTVLLAPSPVAPNPCYCAYGRSGGWEMSNLKYCCRNEAPLYPDSGQGKRPRKRWPCLRIGLSKERTGSDIKSTTLVMALRHQQGQPRRNYSYEDGMPCCYSPDAIRPPSVR
jgi:hypothetical protein